MHAKQEHIKEEERRPLNHTWGLCMEYKGPIHGYRASLCLCKPYLRWFVLNIQNCPVTTTIHNAQYVQFFFSFLQFTDDSLCKLVPMNPGYFFWTLNPTDALIGNFESFVFFSRLPFPRVHQIGVAALQ